MTPTSSAFGRRVVAGSTRSFLGTSQQASLCTYERYSCSAVRANRSESADARASRSAVDPSEQSVQRRSSTRANARPMHAMQATLAARRYFLDGWTIKKIAGEFGMSRFKAARLLEWARDEGLVRIEIVNATRSDAELSAELRSAYGLSDVLVVADLDGAADAIAR